MTMIVISFGPLFAHKGKASFVLEEFSKLTDQIDLLKDGAVATDALEVLLEKGGEKEKDSEIFKKALPITRELGKTTDSKTKQELYGELVILFERVIGYHDRSGAALYHCPKTGKQWITNSEIVKNPFDRKNTSCIRKKENRDSPSK
ncbi:hypothetical protein A0128_17905 [Leptospira tipperaryensis]|uniref:DUF3347 domain-containing protein n=1 Tax=Leptospira tipperaryensis TaxID=2564040 RepID=A0A1D7V149_9LEPT|nr:hypothetical protein [Leptospira tipperaryensis]AOP35550.1 hypothetical protein A0128_17905 [Leptospira tipperaryensis]